MSISLTQATIAVGALGSAATGLVDSTKAFFNGGMSRAGFAFISDLVRRMVPGNAAGAGLTVDDICNTLFANWINGMDPGSQKAIAKSFIKLHLNPQTADELAKQTNVDSAALLSIAGKLAAVLPLTPAESDAYGRFDLSISALVDRAYERADQLYRNRCKVLACIFAIILALVANWQLHHLISYPEAFVIGLIATPLAPVAKDIANAIQTASDSLQKVKG